MGKGQVPSPSETSHPQFSQDARSLLWPPLALHVWIHARTALGSGDWLAPFQVGFPRQSLRLAPLRDTAPGQVGVSSELSLKFAPQQTFPGLGWEDTAKCA